MTCKANGCPLAPDFVTHWDDDGKPRFGVCLYHRQAQPENWQAVTRRIQGARDIIAAVRFFRNNSDPIFNPAPGESFNVYLNRCEAQLRQLVLSGGVGIEGADEVRENFRRIIQLMGN